MHADQSQGEKIIPVLFEEMDGVWLHMQDSNHKKMKKQELKVFTMYEGWDEEKEKEKRSTLVEKTMLAGMEPSQKFHEKREAMIERKYNVDEIQQRILNGDGGSWIKEPYDPDVIFQLDRYHIYQEILRKQTQKIKEARKPESCINTSTIIKRACYHTKNRGRRFRHPKKESSIKTWECRNPRIVL